MKRALRPSLVITVSLSLGACNSTRTSNPPPPEMSHNPPMPTTTAAAGGAPSEGSAGAPLEVATAPQPYISKNPPAPEKDGPKVAGGAFKTHPRDARGHLILKDAQGGCFVEIPVPTDKPLPPGGRSIRVEKLTCPPLMSDPAYAKCVGGTIQLQPGGCSCFIGGNPPPPAVALTCPAQ